MLGGGLELYTATLPSGHDWDSAVTNFTVTTTTICARVGGQWDALAMEGPCYVRGIDGGVTYDRIYYEGYDSAAATVGDDHIAIGYLEWSGSAWVRHGAAVLEATESWEFWNGANGHCNMPSVIYDSTTGLWHIWYTTGGAGGTFYEAYANSTDGRTWTNKVRLAAGGSSSFHPKIKRLTGIHFEYHNSSIIQTGAGDGIYGAYAYIPPTSSANNLYAFTQRASVLSKKWHHRQIQGGSLHQLAGGDWMLYYCGRDPGNYSTTGTIVRIQLSRRDVSPVRIGMKLETQFRQLLAT